VRPIPGNAVVIQAWALRRMVSVYNSITRRPHVPRELPLRRLLRSQGFDVPLELTPSRGPAASGSHDGGEVDDVGGLTDDGTDLDSSYSYYSGESGDEHGGDEYGAGNVVPPDPSSYLAWPNS